MIVTLPYKKFKLEQLFPNISYLHTAECSIQRKKKNTWWSSDQHYKHTGGKRQTMHTPDTPVHRKPTDTVLKSVKT